MASNKIRNEIRFLASNWKKKIVPSHPVDECFLFRSLPPRKSRQTLDGKDDIHFTFSMLAVLTATINNVGL